MAKSSWRSDKGEEKCSQATPVFSACRKPLCRVLIFSDSLRALLPAVGWRLPAAAAANPQLAQNGGATETKDAAAGRMEAILVSRFGSVKIHSYLSPADGLQVNTQMIEGPKRSSSSMVSSCCHMPTK